MVIFVFTGMNNHEKVLDLVDKCIADGRDWYVFGSNELWELDCFDTESGKRYTGAEALAKFIELRKVVLANK